MYSVKNNYKFYKIKKLILNLFIDDNVRSLLGHIETKKKLLNFS